VIDSTNNTVQGFVDGINKANLGVNAAIINTGNKERPYQIVLTSAKTGSDGKIEIAIELKGEGEAPTFDPYYNQPSKWKDVKQAPDEVAKKAVAQGPVRQCQSWLAILLGKTLLNSPLPW
jgi:flagellar capping protein FliD